VQARRRVAVEGVAVPPENDVVFGPEKFSQHDDTSFSLDRRE
jgi:hypothetical protein